MAPDFSAVDRNSLRDRLFADAVCATVRDARLFTRAEASVHRSQTEQYVNARAAVHRADLGGSEADAEWAKTAALNMWRAALAKERQSDRVVYLLSTVAARLLYGSGSDVALRVVHQEPGREILQWRFVSLALPPSVLIAALSARGNAPNACSVHLLARSFAPDGPVAELHVHHAAMLKFESVWASIFYYALTSPGAFFTAVQDRRAICPRLHTGPCDTRSDRAQRSHMGTWADVLRQAFIARRLMQRHLWHAPATFRDCKECFSCAPALDGFMRGWLKSHAQGVTPYPWPEELQAMCRDRRTADDASRRRDGNSRRDWLEEEAQRERFLLAAAFKYLSPDEIVCHDPMFERLFVQYLRIKTALYRLIVHAPGEHGLNNFIDHFKQIKVYAPEADTLPPSVTREEDIEVEAVEYRVAPDAWLANRRRSEVPLAGTALPMRRASSRSSDVESAWLVHFKRKREHSGPLPLFSSVIHELEKYGEKIIQTFTFEPVILQALRGMDLCGVERDQPLWVASETLRRVISASSRVIALRPRSTIKPLRLTLHAGEDLTWLTSGVRAVAEPFVWKLMQRGDRIGHGIAITMTPADWWGRRAGRVFKISRMDQFLNLAFLARYASKRTSEQNTWLHAKIRSIAEAIWPPQLVSESKDLIADAVEFWEKLGTSLTRTFAKMHRKPLISRAAYGWLYSYLWDRSTQHHAAAEIPLSVEPGGDVQTHKISWRECELLAIARQELIRELAAWQVCIETNPTSNLVVGGLDAMAAQDFLHRRPTVAACEGAETLTWTISTDDPITFSTTLADEYAYAWAGMVLRMKHPYDPAYARALLDEAAATSMRMRFTIPVEHQDADSQPQGRILDRR